MVATYLRSEIGETVRLESDKAGEVTNGRTLKVK
jgi:hypothetical protein